MKKFLVIYSNKDKERGSNELTCDHVEFLKEIKKKNKLLLCGPLLNQEKSVLILKEESREKALEIVYRDPFIQTHYYGKFDLSEILEANDDNNWLM